MRAFNFQSSAQELVDVIARRASGAEAKRGAAIEGDDGMMILMGGEMSNARSPTCVLHHHTTGRAVLQKQYVV